MNAPVRPQARPEDAIGADRDDDVEGIDVPVRVWRWPVVIGLASLLGLVSALVGDGGWDALSWATLALPVVIAGTAWRRARRRPTRSVR